MEEAADQIQNQTVKVITAANEAVADILVRKSSRDLCEIYAETEYRPGVWCSFFKGDRGSPAGRMFFHGKSRSAGKGSGKQENRRECIMATQQVNAAKLKSTGVNLTNLAAKMKSEMNKLDENIQKVSSVWSGEASASYLKRYQADKANLAQLTQILQQMGAALGEFSNSYTQADNKAMDLVHKYLGK